jgi:uncharacterized membrane protein YozB (DUF420 family)
MVMFNLFPLLIIFLIFVLVILAIGRIGAIRGVGKWWRWLLLAPIFLLSIFLFGYLLRTLFLLITDSSGNPPINNNSAK